MTCVGVDSQSPDPERLERGDTDFGGKARGAMKALGAAKVRDMVGQTLCHIAKLEKLGCYFCLAGEKALLDAWFSLPALRRKEPARVSLEPLTWFAAQEVPLVSK